MYIIKGDKPEPNPEPEHTFLDELMLTHAEVDLMLIREQITREQYDKLIKEIAL